MAQSLLLSLSRLGIPVDLVGTAAHRDAWFLSAALALMPELLAEGSLYRSHTGGREGCRRWHPLPAALPGLYLGCNLP